METTRDDRMFLGTVGAAMTATVLTCAPDEPLGDAARRLECNGVSGAPVLRDRRVVGVVTLRDILGTEPHDIGSVVTSGPWLRRERDLDRSGRMVEDVMSRRAVTVRASDRVADAAASMVAAGSTGFP